MRLLSLMTLLVCFDVFGTAALALASRWLARDPAGVFNAGMLLMGRDSNTTGLDARTRCVRWTRTYAVLMALTIVASLGGGCTLIGLGVGANANRYEPVNDPDTVKLYEEIRVELKNDEAQRAEAATPSARSRTAWVNGRQGTNTDECITLVIKDEQ